jgi:hypothetical protein
MHSALKLDQFHLLHTLVTHFRQMELTNEREN